MALKLKIIYKKNMVVLVTQGTYVLHIYVGTTTRLACFWLAAKVDVQLQASRS